MRALAIDREVIDFWQVITMTNGRSTCSEFESEITARDFKRDMDRARLDGLVDEVTLRYGFYE